MKTYKLLYKNESLGEIKTDNNKIAVDLRINVELDIQEVNSVAVPIANEILSALKLLKRTVGALVATRKVKKFLDELNLETEYTDIEEILNDGINLLTEIPGIEIAEEVENEYFSY